MIISFYQVHVILLLSLLTDAIPSYPERSLLHGNAVRPSRPASLAPPKPAAEVPTAPKPKAPKPAEDPADGDMPSEDPVDGDVPPNTPHASTDPSPSARGPFKTSAIEEWSEKLGDLIDMIQNLVPDQDLPDSSTLSTGQACSSCSSFGGLSGCPRPALNYTTYQASSSQNISWSNITGQINDSKCNQTEILGLVVANMSSTAKVTACGAAVRQSYAEWYNWADAFCRSTSNSSGNVSSQPTVANRADRLGSCSTLLLFSSILSIFAFFI